MTVSDPSPTSVRSPGVLFVPARPGPHCLVARMFRNPMGQRTAVGFTSASKLTVTLGTSHGYTRLCERALRELAALQGITELTIDPPLAAPTATSTPQTRWDDWPASCAASLSDLEDFERVGA